jgi:hypothetical protein
LTRRANPDCLHRKSLSWRQLQSLVHNELTISCSARSVPKESLRDFRLDGRRDEVFHGTDFRHAVEFSRSGRAPSQPSPAGQGQPDLRYSRSVAPVKLTDLRPASHLVAAHRLRSAARRAWGMSGRLPLGLRSPNKENISQPDPAESNRPLSRTKSPCLLGCRHCCKQIDHRFARGASL